MSELVPGEGTRRVLFGLSRFAAPWCVHPLSFLFSLIFCFDTSRGFFFLSTILPHVIFLENKAAL
jgi:hypothetical protein